MKLCYKQVRSLSRKLCLVQHNSSILGFGSVSGTGLSVQHAPPAATKPTSSYQSTCTFALPKTPPWLYRITPWLYRNQSQAINQSNCSISNRQTLNDGGQVSISWQINCHVVNVRTHTTCSIEHQLHVCHTCAHMQTMYVYSHVLLICLTLYFHLSMVKFLQHLMKLLLCDTVHIKWL